MVEVTIFGVINVGSLKCSVSHLINLLVSAVE